MSDKMLAPPFTPQNAREMQARAVASRLAKQVTREDEARARAAQASTEARDIARQGRVKAQIDIVDDAIDAALKRQDWDALENATKVKARLWPLAQPTAGVLRPRSGKPGRSAPPSVTETPQAPAPVVPQKPPSEPPAT